MRLIHVLFFVVLASSGYAQFELDSLKTKWQEEGREDIEGVYSLSSGSNSYTVVLAKEDEIYKLVYLAGKQPEWLYGDLKGVIAPSEEKVYEGKWNAGQPSSPLLENVKIVFGDKKFILYWSDWSIDEFKMTYPEKADGSTKINDSFDESLFTRNHISVPIQKSDSGSIEIPILVNDVLKIYVGLEKTSDEIVLSKEIAKTLIQTKTVGYREWLEGNYYEFTDPNKPFRATHVFNINSLKVGTRELTNVKARISDNLVRSMVINIEVLEKLGKISIDMENDILTITK